MAYLSRTEVSYSSYAVCADFTLYILAKNLQELPNILQLFQNQLDEAEKGIHTKSMDLDAANKMIKKFTDIDFEVRHTTCLY